MFTYPIIGVFLIELRYIAKLEFNSMINTIITALEHWTSDRLPPLEKKEQKKYENYLRSIYVIVASFGRWARPPAVPIGKGLEGEGLPSPLSAGTLGRPLAVHVPLC